MNTITATFTDDYRTQVGEYIDLLFAIAKRGNSTGEQRAVRVGELTEAYYVKAGRHADSNVLERLGSLILYDDLSDPHPDKVTREEYPIMSDSQLDEREKGEHLLGDVLYGRDKAVGYKAVSYEDANGVVRSARKKLFDFQS